MKAIHKIKEVHFGYDKVWCGREIPLPSTDIRLHTYRDRTTHYWSNVTCKNCLKHRPER